MYGWDVSTRPWYGIMLGPIVIIIFIALTVLVIARVLRPVGLESRSRVQSKSALDLLKDRLARGEIDRAEYDEIRQLLTRP